MNETGDIADALRESEARQAFLVRLEDALRPLADAGAIQHAAARVLGEHLRVTRVMYADVEGEPGAEVGTIRGRYHGPDGQALAPFPERYAYSVFGERVMTLRRRGEKMVVADVNTDPAFDAKERAAWVANGVRAAITVSLVKEGRMVADFGVQSAAPRSWTAQEIALVQATAERTRAAVERARAEETVRQERDRIQQYLDVMGSLMVVLDRHGTVVLANREACDTLGYSEADVVGKDWFEHFLPEQGRRQVRDAFDRMVRGEIPLERHENAVLAAGGRERMIQWHNAVLRDPDGRLASVLGSGVDVTERRRAEEALRASEERFRTLADNMDQLAWMAEPRGDFLWFNKRWHDYTGATVGGVDASNWRRLIHPGHAPRVVERSERCHRQGEAWEDTFPLQGRTGEYRWFLGRAVPIKDDQGRLLRWFGTMTDITELEQRNAQLQRLSVQLTTIEQHERRRLAITLHDGLQQLIVAAKLRLPQCLEEDGREQMQHIDRLLDEAMEAVRSLAWELSPPALGISTLPQALEWLADWFQRQHGFRISLRAPEAIPPLPEHAKSLLFSAVRELLLNCVKHSGVKAATLEVHTDAAHELQILVADDGAGFDPATAVYGIGLSSIRERLVALGGRLVVNSTPGRGARFTLMLSVPKAQTKKVSPVQLANARHLSVSKFLASRTGPQTP